MFLTNREENRMKFIKSFLAILTFALFSFSANAEKWDMALAYPAGNFHSANAKEFADNVTKKTNGKVQIVTHPGGSLIKGGDIFRAVRTGQVQIGERFMSALSSEDPLYEIDLVPFLATSYKDAWNLYAASRQALVKSLDAKGVVFLYAVPWPAQSLYSKKPISKVADLKGLKLRTPNSATVRVAELTGMQPTKIEAAEISQAFSTGAVEGMITSATTGKDSKIWENGVKYFYDISAWFPKNMMVVNKSAWNKLDAATKKIIREEAAAAEKKGWDLSRKANTEDKKALKAKGMVVASANAELKAHFQKVGTQMTEEWSKKAGAAGSAVLAKYKK